MKLVVQCLQFGEGIVTKKELGELNDKGDKDLNFLNLFKYILSKTWITKLLHNKKNCDSWINFYTMKAT